MKKISVIIPALNEVEHIKQSLQSVQSLRKKGHEVIVVDGGSNDETYSIASDMADQIIGSHSERNSISLSLIFESKS